MTSLHSCTFQHSYSGIKSNCSYMVCEIPYDHLNTPDSCLSQVSRPQIRSTPYNNTTKANQISKTFKSTRYFNPFQSFNPTLLRLLQHGNYQETGHSHPQFLPEKVQLWSHQPQCLLVDQGQPGLSLSPSSLVSMANSCPDEEVQRLAWVQGCSESLPQQA